MKELDVALREAVVELLSMFGIESNFTEEKETEKLASSCEVNVIVGLTGRIKGNLVLGITTKTALKIVSCMMCGMEVPELDDMAISGISEFANMLGGTTITKIQTENLIDLSPPTVITSDGTTTVISQLKSHNLNFSVCGENLVVSYCVKS